MERISHICQGGSAVIKLRAALGVEVCEVCDDCATGPLSDVDTVEAPQRYAFWSALFAAPEIQPAPPWEAMLRAAFDTLAGLAHHSDEVVIWAGESATEQLLRRRVHWWLRAAALPVSEVILGTPDRPDERFPVVVATASIEVLRAGLASRRQVPPLERQRLAKEWQTLRAGGAGVREWTQDRFRELAIDGYDAQLLRLVGNTPKRFLSVLGQAMAETSRTDLFCKWRYQLLQQAGHIVLQSDGVGNWRSALVCRAHREATR